jgi:hypothetical protein
MVNIPSQSRYTSYAMDCNSAAWLACPLPPVSASFSVCRSDGVMASPEEINRSLIMCYQVAFAPPAVVLCNSPYKGFFGFLRGAFVYAA